MVSRGALPYWALGSCGDGDGYGSGDGYWVSVFQDQKPMPLLDEKNTIAFWWSDINGQSANGGSGKQRARPGLVEKIPGPLELCTAGALHGTFAPEKWKGSRLWIVALRGEIVQYEDKVGALEREILAEVDWRRKPIG